jgi:hypothetical protein
MRLLCVLCALTLLYAFNPSAEKHGNVYFQENYGAVRELLAGDALGSSLMINFLRSERVVYQDFFLFSLLWQRDRHEVLTFGLLGFVKAI